MEQPTYDRPVKARLVVELDNGERWDATDEDIKQFRLLDSVTAQCAVSDAMEALGFDVEREHSSVRHFIQMHVAATPEYIGDDTKTGAKQLVATWTDL